jgi:hypothetical protein
MILLGISGKKGSGKSTIAEILKQYITHRPVHIIAFADALKDEVAHACGVSREYVEKNKAIFRPILQWWGTDFRRNLTSEDYWLRVFSAKVSILPNDSLILIPDVRFPNELQLIKKARGKVWRVNRDIPYYEESKSIKDIHPSVLV